MGGIVCVDKSVLTSAVCEVEGVFPHQKLFGMLKGCLNRTGLPGGIEKSALKSTLAGSSRP